MEIWCPDCKMWELARKQVRVDATERPAYAVIETLCSMCKRLLFTERIYMPTD